MEEKLNLEIGEKYWVQWRDNQRHIAEIIEKRPHRRGRDQSSGVARQSAPSLKIEEFEYYVHYCGFDRRLDEWVPFNRIDLKNLVTETDEAPVRTITKRPSKRKFDDIITDPNTPMGATSNKDLLALLEKEHEEITKVKNIQCIVIGKYEIDTWYFSPFPEEYCGEERLYICEFCLKYMKRKRTLIAHFEKCHAVSPPGRQIYSDAGLSMFEVDGKTNKLYCQNLCLLSKLFLDHKTLYYDVDPFMFYVMCEVDESGHHIVGYFSKEKVSQENYNLACILTFPPYQRKGYGKFLISVSYELTKREHTTGSPEKPLSDLGKISYRSYWAFVILQYLQRSMGDHSKLTVVDIGRNTGIRTEDILSTLHSLNLIKFWKGQHVISISPEIISNLLMQTKTIRLCKSECLTWEPPKKVKDSTKKSATISAAAAV